MKDKRKEPAQDKTEKPHTGGHLLRVVVGLLVGGAILGGSAFAAWHFWNTRPLTRPMSKARAPLQVEVIPLQPVDFAVRVPSQGRVKSRAVSGIVPEVTGRIVKIAANFREGGSFEPSQPLVWLDPTNAVHAIAEANATVRQLQAKLDLERINRSSYTNAVTLAQAELRKTEAALELARARQAAAIASLKLLDTFDNSTPLARHEPQMKEATATVQSAAAELAKALVDLEQRPARMEAELQAQIDAAGARLSRAQTDLARTIIRAPSFDGRIVEKSADVGQHVSTSTTLARAIAVDYAEVRLPISRSLLSQIEMSGISGSTSPGPAVDIHLPTSDPNSPPDWTGRVERTEARVDRSSQQHFLIARVDAPFAQPPFLHEGLFVRARIHGRVHAGVFEIPRDAVRRGGEILLVDRENRLRRVRMAEAFWRDERKILIREVIQGNQQRPLRAGEWLCISNVDYAPEGELVVPNRDGKPLPRSTPKGKNRPGKAQLSKQ